MAIPERDTVYTNDGTTNRSVYTRESSSTGWFVGIIVALALLAIGYLVFSANSGPATVVDTNTTTFEAPVIEPATPAPMTEAPATSTAPATDVAPMTEAPAATTEAAPMTEAPAAIEAAPATEAPAPAEAAPVTEPAPAATTTP